MLSLLGVLAKDLGLELVLHISDLLMTVFGVVLDPADVDMTTLCFSKVSELFIHSGKKLVSSSGELAILEPFYDSLLGHKKEYIRRLSGDCFAHVVRQGISLKVQRRCIERLFEVCSDQTREGTAHFLFALLRSVQGNLHSSTPQLWTTMLQYAKDSETDLELVGLVMELLQRHLTDDPSRGKVIYEQLIAMMVKTTLPSPPLCVLLGQWVGFKHGRLVPSQIDHLVLVSLLKKQRSYPLRAACWDMALTRRDQGFLTSIEEHIKSITKQDDSEELLEFLHQCFHHINNKLALHRTFNSVVKQVVKRFIVSDQPGAAAEGLILLAAFARTVKQIQPVQIPSELGFLITESFANGDGALVEGALECLKECTCEPALLDKLVNKSLLDYVMQVPTQEHCYEATKVLFDLAPLDFPLRIKQNLVIFLSDTDHSDESALTTLDHVLRPNDALQWVGGELLLARNMWMPDVRVRKASISILSKLFSESTILSLLHKITQLDYSLENERKRQGYLETLLGVLNTETEHPEEREIITHAACGFFFVRFSPLWPLAGKLLAALLKSDFERHWVILQEFIVRVCLSGEEEQEEDDEDEDKQDPLLAHTSNQKVFEALFQVLSTIPSVMDRRSKFMVPMFLRFLRDHYYSSRSDDLDSPSQLELEEEAKVLEQVPESGFDGAQMSRRGTARRLLGWLTVIQSAVNPKGLFAAHVVKMVCIRLLVKTDSQTVELALRCLLKFKDPFLYPYRATLLTLARKDGEFRDAMSRFVFVEEGDSKVQSGFHKVQDTGLDAGEDRVKGAHVIPAHRAGLLPVVIRLLFSKMQQRKGKKTSKDKFSLSAKRAAVLSFLSGLDAHELAPFFEIMFRPFPMIDIHTTFSNLSSEAISDQIFALSPVVGQVCLESGSRAMGFVNMLTNVVKQLGTRAMVYLPAMLTTLLALLHFTDQEVVEEEHSSSKVVRELRTECLRRLAEILGMYTSFDFSILYPVFQLILNSFADRLPGSVVGATHPSAFLLLIKAFSHSQIHVLEAVPLLLPQTIRCLSSGIEKGKGIGPHLLSVVLTVLENLVLNPDPELNELGTRLVMPHLNLLLDQFILRLGVSKGVVQQISKEASVSTRELALLSKLGSLLAAQQEKNESSGQLISLLLPFVKDKAVVRLAQRANNQKDLREQIFETCASLVPLSLDPMNHVSFLAKLLGPFPPSASDAEIHTDCFGKPPPPSVHP